MLRRFGNANAFSAALAATTTTASRSSGVLVHKPKKDINLGGFNYEREMQEFRDSSTRPEVNVVSDYRKAYWRADEYMRRADEHMKSQGFFYLPIVDFAFYKGCLPLMSAYQFRVHYHRHHRAYVDKLNAMVEGTKYAGLHLDELIQVTKDDPAQQGLFNNAAQHYNHMFFWKSLEPHGTNMPPDLKAAVEAQYGSVEKLQAAFTDAALKLFGSGWVYWVYDLKAQQFDLVSYTNAGCPLTDINLVPLLTCDVWEHAYYIDYQNDRSKYVSKFFDVADYHWAERNWKRGRGEKYEPMNYY